MMYFRVYMMYFRVYMMYFRDYMMYSRDYMMYFRDYMMYFRDYHIRSNKRTCSDKRIPWVFFTKIVCKSAHCSTKILVFDTNFTHKYSINHTKT